MALAEETPIEMQIRNVTSFRFCSFTMETLRASMDIDRAKMSPSTIFRNFLPWKSAIGTMKAVTMTIEITRNIGIYVVTN